MQLTDSISCRWFRWVKESQISYQNHIVFIVNTEIRFFIEKALLSHSNNPHALTVHSLTYLARFILQFYSQRMYVTGKFGMRTYLKHFFYRSLCYNLTLSLGILNYYRHAATCKVERNLVHFTVIIFQIFKRKVFHVRKDSLVHKVFQSGLEETVEIGMTQDTLVLVVAAIGIDIFFKDYLVASQCTGLVRT